MAWGAPNHYRSGPSGDGSGFRSGRRGSLTVRSGGMERAFCTARASSSCCWDQAHETQPPCFERRVAKPDIQTMLDGQHDGALPEVVAAGHVDTWPELLAREQQPGQHRVPLRVTCAEHDTPALVGKLTPAFTQIVHVASLRIDVPGPVLQDLCPVRRQRIH